MKGALSMSELEPPPPPNALVHLQGYMHPDLYTTHLKLMQALNT